MMSERYSNPVDQSEFTDDAYQKYLQLLQLIEKNTNEELGELCGRSKEGTHACEGVTIDPTVDFAPKRRKGQTNPLSVEDVNDEFMKVFGVNSYNIKTVMHQELGEAVTQVSSSALKQGMETTTQLIAQLQLEARRLAREMDRTRIDEEIMRRAAENLCPNIAIPERQFIPSGLLTSVQAEAPEQASERDIQMEQARKILQQRSSQEEGDV